MLYRYDARDMCFRSSTTAVSIQLHSTSWISPFLFATNRLLPTSPSLLGTETRTALLILAR